MYKIYENFNSNGRYLSYYTIESLWNHSEEKPKNLQFQIYEQLQNSYFDSVVRGNKSIIYDYVHIVFEEFQLSLESLSDEELWSIVAITWRMLKKKYHCPTQNILNETFKDLERYFRGGEIKYQRLNKYGKINHNRLENMGIYLDG